MSSKHTAFQSLPTSALQYVEWAGEKYSDSFYTSDKVKTLYKNNIKAMTSHVNAINGIAFKDDPTIFAWGEQLCTLFTIALHIIQ